MATTAGGWYGNDYGDEEGDKLWNTEFNICYILLFKI